MKKTVTFISWDPKRDFHTDNLVCRVRFSVVDAALIGTPREVESFHTIKVIMTDILMGNWRIPGGLDFGITNEMIQVSLQSLEDYIVEQLKKGPQLVRELDPLLMTTENSPATCPFKLLNILYPNKKSFTVEVEEQPVQPDTLHIHPNIQLLLRRMDDALNRKDHCCPVNY
jgi:hypothetical protein